MFLLISIEITKILIIPINTSNPNTGGGCCLPPSPPGCLPMSRDNCNTQTLPPFLTRIKSAS